MRESFDWLKPSLLRRNDAQDFREPDFFQPQLLEFRSDDFMEEFLAAVINPKTDTLKTAVMVVDDSQQPQKLFQPAHGRFYLVSASLCCRLSGFPERKVQVEDAESAFFVLRKFIGGAEYAWVIEGAKGHWQPLNGGGREILDQEERLPLLRATGSNDQTLWFGYLPVANGQTYSIAPTELADINDLKDLRMEELRERFVVPLTDRKDAVLGVATKADQKDGQQRALTLSVFMLLDLWEFFYIYLEEVAKALRDDPTADFPADQAKAKLMRFLRGQLLGSGVTLAQALGQVARHRAELDRLGEGQVTEYGFGDDFDLTNHTLNLVDLQTAVQQALPSPLPPLELPKLIDADKEDRTIHYAIRCVYERPQCEPVVRVVSQPSLRFQLASFFDADAPARPVHISLPTDVSIAGLRRFNKGVTFLISNSLQKKINSLTGKEKELLKDDPQLGEETDGGFAFICSFSIQIIFIVAFFLLLMFVIILNFVFWWIAFFRICLPIPKKLFSG